jgi:hypothetical protein
MQMRIDRAQSALFGHLSAWSGIEGAMRSSLVVGSGLLLVACGASDVQSKRLKDGSWAFTCELPMDECVRRVQTNCPNQRFRILEGTSETRIRDVPPFEQSYHTSRLHLTCTNDGATVLLSLDGAKPAESQRPAAATCTRGQTRECVGPGACKGGQACLPDGTGFGACDCGPVTPSPAPLPTESIAPAPASVEPAPPPVTPASGGNKP